MYNIETTIIALSLFLLIIIAGGIVAIFLKLNELSRSYASSLGFPLLPRKMLPSLMRAHGGVYWLSEIIDSAEKQAGITLSWGAREMLIIPVIELIESGREHNREVIKRSIFDLIETAAENRYPEYLSNRECNSVSIIRAFHYQFCNIPPFCERKEDY